jgi:hypothetical protein
MNIYLLQDHFKDIFEDFFVWLFLLPIYTYSKLLTAFQMDQCPPTCIVQSLFIRVSQHPKFLRKDKRQTSAVI